MAASGIQLGVSPSAILGQRGMIFDWLKAAISGVDKAGAAAPPERLKPSCKKRAQFVESGPVLTNFGQI